MSEDDPAEERSDGAGDDGAAETDGTAADDEAVDAGEESDTETDEVESETEEPVDESAADGADPEKEESGGTGGSEPTEESDGDVDPHDVVDISPDIEDATTDADEEAEETAPTVTAEELNARLDEAEEELDAAETESDLDDVEARLDDVEADVEAAALPEPDEDDEDEEEAEDPREQLETRLSDLREALAEQRGPYADEVVTDVEEAQSTLTDTRWTERGLTQLAGPVESFLDDVNETLRTDLERTGSNPDGLASDLDDAVEAVEAADLDPDDDATVIEGLLEATDALASGLDDAEEWDDLQTHEKLEAEGYYDCLGHYKDFPPEWAAMKEWEKRGNVEMVLLALDSLQSEFMEDHAMETLIRMSDDGAFEEMHQRAGKRDKPAIRALGTMAADDEEAVETLVEYVDADSDPALQNVTFKALGQIGHPDAVQPLANKLVVENDNVRSGAARALGLIGDTRAVDPLADVLEDDDSDNVRAAAAWALRQIGTEAALEAAASAGDDRAFIVQAEADKASETLADGEAEATA